MADSSTPNSAAAGLGSPAFHEALRRAEAAERRLAEVESSTSYRFGSIAVGMVRNPKSAIRAVSRKARRKPGSRRKELSASAISSAKPEVVGTNVPALAPPVSEFAITAPILRAGALASGLTVGAVLHPRTLTLLSPYADLVVLAPHNASQTIRARHVDFVFIETAAADAGSPWIHLGDPGSPNIERAALELATACHERGIPIVLWRNTPDFRTVMLNDLASSCTVVVAGSLASGATRWDLASDVASSLDELVQLLGDDLSWAHPTEATSYSVDATVATDEMVSGLIRDVLGQSPTCSQVIVRHELTASARSERTESLQTKGIVTTLVPTSSPATSAQNAVARWIVQWRPNAFSTTSVEDLFKQIHSSAGLLPHVSIPAADGGSPISAGLKDALVRAGVGS